MRKFVPGFVFLLIPFIVSAQMQTGSDAGRPATGMRAEGKIYVVMAVALTILIGLFIYLIRLDRKITKLEKKSQ